MMCKIKRKRLNSFGQTVRFFSCFLALFVLLSGTAYSQAGSKINVKGVVTDALGDPLIGATVSEKGTTNATMTGVDGDYALNISPDATLSVTFVGFITQDIAVNGKAAIDIVLEEDSKLLDEVVVTALGIKRDKKSLGYALQEVKGEDLLKNRDANVANSLTGKVAGLQIKQASTGVGGSSRIMLRGNSSITGGNQPLIVVDGVPIDGGTGADNDDRYGETLVDRGSGMSDVSPDDIESISVLKGPAAAALYGSRAGNGVIMITTKTGKGTQGIGISYTTNLTFENPMMKPKYQNTYGQGSANTWDATSENSWGAKMEGQKFTNYIGNDIVYNRGDMDIDNFIRTGTSWTNSLDITSSSEKASVRLGVMNLQNKGVVPNSDMSKTSVTLRGTAELTSKLSLDAKGTFLQQKVNNRVRLGANLDNIFYQFLRTPRSVNLGDFSWGDKGYIPEYYEVPYNPYAYPAGIVDVTKSQDLKGRPISYAPLNAGSTNNPYWSVYNNTNNDRRTRFMGFASLKYQITDWLSVQGRYGIDYIATQSQDIFGSGTYFTTYQDKNGNIMTNKSDSYEMNADFLVTLNKQLTDKLGLVATVGGNRMYSRTDGVWATANGLGIEYYYDLSNAAGPQVRNSLLRKKINSLYGTASFAWDNTFYLDVTARNDWSSTLNPDNRSYFYPSVGGSWLFTETFKDIKFVDYGKVRLSWAQVGNDVDPYRLINYRITDGPYTGKKSPIKANYDLKSETIDSYEIGLEMRGLQNRIGIDFSFYNKETKDLITTIDTPPATGYSKEWINAGNIRNRGVELLIYGSPVKTRDFEWEVSLNWSKNNNKVLKLASGQDRQILSHSSYSGEIIIVADEGGSYGDMYGKPYTRKNGEIQVDDQGLPTFESEYVKLGNSSPDWMGGITNTFKYKGFDMSFLIDMRYGGNVYMGSYRTGASMGTLDFTEAGRDKMIVPGVKADGTANNIETRADLYWGRMTNNTLGGSEPWIYDATNIRLRELTIGYTFPRKLLAKTPIKGARLSFVGRNLWMIHSKTDGFDPEAGFTTGNAQGYELGSMPTLRSLGFNVNITF